MATDPERDTVIVVERVTKRFRNAVAVDRVDLKISQGEFFSLLGPSGCGKTTTLRMIAGFETPTEGRILLEGRDVSDVPPYKRDVNLVFQNYALFPHMNVFDNIAFGPRNKGMSRAGLKVRVEEILRVVRMEGFGDRKPGQLSGGQQQRVALARALVNRPRALLLDEPLGALDLKLRRAMQLELKQIQRELGITFVYVTHDQEEALTMSDRVAVMSAGRVAQVGTPEEIYDKPATTFVAGFIGVANILGGTVDQVQGESVTLALDGGGWTSAGHNEGDLSSGQRASVVLRPERMRLSVTPPDSETVGRIQARVEAIVFQGAVTRVDLTIAGGAPVTVLLLAQERPEGVAESQEVWITWAPESACVLPGDPPAEADAPD
ncbi:MAG: ABC transporter ATP-binding protein [Dehalococcoidia bacterium]